MCTALTLLTHDHYFGRNLDLEYAYKETVTVIPRNFPLTFRHSQAFHTHYAMIGMAFVSDYSSCCNTDRGIYYYQTYENSGISAVDLHRENLDSSRLISYPLKKAASFDLQN